MGKELTSKHGDPVDGRFFGSDLYINLGENVWQKGDELVSKESVDLSDSSLFDLAQLEWLGARIHIELTFISERVFLAYKSLPKTDFREVKWGMSREKVIQAVKSNDTSFQGDFLISDDEMLAYEATVANMPCIATYHFTQNILISAAYHFREEHTNENDYIHDYSKLKSILEKKYGKPSDDDVTWNDSLYKDNKERWGFAVSSLEPPNNMEDINFKYIS